MRYFNGHELVVEFFDPTINEYKTRNVVSGLCHTFTAFFVENSKNFTQVHAPATSPAPKYSRGDVLHSYSSGNDVIVDSYDPVYGYTVTDTTTGRKQKPISLYLLEDPNLFNFLFFTGLPAPVPPSPQQLFAESEGGVTYYEVGSHHVCGDIVGWIDVPGSGEFIIMDASAGFIGPTTGLQSRGHLLIGLGTPHLTCVKRTGWPPEVILFKSQNVLTKLSSPQPVRHILSGHTITVAPGYGLNAPIVEVTIHYPDKPDPNYPHKCPKCQAPAYMGFSKIDCKAKCGA